MSSGFVDAGKDGALVRLRVSPGTGRTAFRDIYGEVALKLSVTVPPVAPPLDGKANAEVVRDVEVSEARDAPGSRLL